MAFRLQYFGVRLILTGLVAVMLAGCSTESITGKKVTSLPNPASVNCIKQGGKLVLEKSAEGEYGVCLFEDNRQCEEWALLRGQCPGGGIKVTGYTTKAAVYCAITGGVYKVKAHRAKTKSNMKQEQGSCTFYSGKVCDAKAYYYGKCTKT